MEDPGERRRGGCSFFFPVTTPMGPNRPRLGIVVGGSVGDVFGMFSANPGVTRQALAVHANGLQVSPDLLVRLRPAAAGPCRAGCRAFVQKSRRTPKVSRNEARNANS